MKKVLFVIFIQLIYVPAFGQCSVTATQQNDHCGTCNGTATAIPSGVPAFSYAWSDGQTTQTATGLCQGLYTVTVTDASSCTSSAVVSIQSNTGGAVPSITDATCSGCCNGTAMVSPYGGCAPYTYSWSPGGQTTDSIGSLCAGNYVVQVTDSCGCIFYVPVSIAEPPLTVYSQTFNDPRIIIGPNPSLTGIFVLNAFDIQPGYYLQIDDLSGRNFYRAMIAATTCEIRLDQYSPGIYFYSVTDNRNAVITRGKIVSAR